MNSLTSREAIKRSWVTVCNNQIPCWKFFTGPATLSGSQHPSLGFNERRTNCSCPIKAFWKAGPPAFTRHPKSSARHATAPNATTGFIASNKALNCCRVSLGASELSDMCTSATGLRVSPSTPVDFKRREKLGSDSRHVLTPHRPLGGCSLGIMPLIQVPAEVFSALASWNWPPLHGVFQVSSESFPAHPSTPQSSTIGQFCHQSQYRILLSPLHSSSPHPSLYPVLLQLLLLGYFIKWITKNNISVIIFI